MQSISNLNNELMNVGLGNNISYELSEYLGQYPTPNYNNYQKLKYSNLAPKTNYNHKNMGYSVPKKPQERIDYINKPNTTTNYVKFNNTPPSPSEITMSFKKQKPVQSYQSREDILYPTMNEQSQIKYTAKKYPLLNNTIQKNYSNIYQEKPMPLMSDKDYVPPKLYEQDLLKKENERLKKQLEYERKINNRADILYGSDEEYYKKFPHRNYPQFDGSMTGGAANINTNNFNNKIEYEKYKLAIDNIGLKPARNEAIKRYGIETAENLYMSKSDSYMNTEYAKQHLVLDNYGKLSGNLKNYFADKITEQLQLSEVSEQQRQYVLDNTKGIYIEPNSESSKKLAEILMEEPDFIKTVKNNKHTILNGKIAEGSIEFKNKNFHYAIGRADIKNIKLNSNGDMTLLVTDVYDFNKDSDSPLIQAGRKRQEEGKIKPYFIIYDVVIPKEYL